MLFSNLFIVIQLINSWDKIFERINSGHGFLVTAIGLFSVFTGLIILWLLTANLQRAIRLSEQILSGLKNYFVHGNPSVTEQVAEEEIDDEEIAAAIITALHLELEAEEVSVLTLRHIEQEMSPWVVASRPSTMRQQQ